MFHFLAKTTFRSRRFRCRRRFQSVLQHSATTLPGFALAACFAHAFYATSIEAASSERPNVVFILADDLGYGEIEALNPDRSKIPTPNLNRLAAQGMTFTDAHTSASVCTPTRYGLLTGRYNWRTRHQSGVLEDGGECLIAEDRLTLGNVFQSQGYQTAIIGKWHLGYQYAENRGKPGKAVKNRSLAAVPVGTRIIDGPVSRGFDTFYGFHHARSMSSIVEQDKIIAEMDTVDVLPSITKRVVDYINDRAAEAKSGKPFFLYFPMSAPHTPIVPADPWKGRGVVGTYGDFVAQTDDSVGQVMEALERNGLDDNTLLVFTADNGTSKAADIGKLQAQGHFPSANLRGSKADLWDGGHRVPFLIRWPQNVEAGAKSNQLICLTDMMATFADLLSVKLPADAGEDSISFLPLLRQQPLSNPRQSIVHHSISGKFAIRLGDWKLLLAPGSGGWSAPTDPQALKAGLPEMQLYNIKEDLGEATNQYDSQPEKIRSLVELLEVIVGRGRSTSGEIQLNDVPIDIWKRSVR